MKKSKKAALGSTIALNKKALHDFFIEERFEAGLCLMGWEVKSIRAGRSQLKESYVLVKQGEAFLFGAHITPLLAASTHVTTDPSRTRKLLLHGKELKKLIGKVEQKGYTIVPLKLYWKKGFIKCEIGLAKGKKLHDKHLRKNIPTKRSWHNHKN